MKSKSLAVMFSLCFFTLGFGPDNSSTFHPALSSTGLSVGQKIPPFTAHDQFGREVSSETLKGAKGTVLLFFRSADW